MSVPPAAFKTSTFYPLRTCGIVSLLLLSATPKSSITRRGPALLGAPGCRGRADSAARRRNGSPPSISRFRFSYIHHSYL